MNEKAKKLMRNLNYTVTANLLVLAISLILNLVVPKIIGITEYSYWQLYIFYSTYVGVFHLGWIDGIYLKIGGEEYKNLDRRSLGTQFYYLFIFQSILGFIILLFSFYLIPDPNKKIILIATALLLIITNLKGFILLVLQSTNRIKEYAKLSVNDRYIYIVLALIYLFTGGTSFTILIGLDVLSRLIVTIWGMTFIKNLLLVKRQRLREVSPEIFDNIQVGSKLMLGNTASLLILGIFRLLVEQNWSIEVFGKLSFALSISNMFMMFITATSVVLYPVLRRTDRSNLSNIYIKVRTVFVPFTLSLLLFFNPIRIVLEWWLPDYATSLFFMGILFPMVVYEGRNFLLVTTYLNTIRQEKVILISNIITLIITTITSYISIYIFKSINLTVISIMLCLALRCIIAESMLAKVLNIKIFKENIIEGIVIIVFITGNIVLDKKISFLTYLIIYIFYFIFNYSKIIKSTKDLLSLMKS